MRASASSHTPLPAVQQSAVGTISAKSASPRFGARSGCIERADHDVIAIRITEREFAGAGIGIQIRFFFELGNEGTRSKRRFIEVVHARFITCSCGLAGGVHAGRYGRSLAAESIKPWLHLPQWRGQSRNVVGLVINDSPLRQGRCQIATICAGCQRPSPGRFPRQHQECGIRCGNGSYFPAHRLALCLVQVIEALEVQDQSVAGFDPGRPKRRNVGADETGCDTRRLRPITRSSHRFGDDVDARNLPATLSQDRRPDPAAATEIQGRTVRLLPFALLAREEPGDLLGGRPFLKLSLMEGARRSARSRHPSGRAQLRTGSAGEFASRGVSRRARTAPMTRAETP